MSDNTEQQSNPKAEAKAAKARAKAQRPWYKKKRWIIPLAVVVLLFIIIGSSGGGDGGEDADLAADDTSEDTDASSSEDEGGSGPERAGIGEPAVDGQFTFTVTDQLDCGQQTIGSGAMAEDAQGQWCILTATVENTGDEARSLSASAQLLFDQEGREFQASVPMAVAGESPIYEQINPGNSVEGRFFFDVPAEGFEPSHVQLHDSAFSGGVQVDLSE